MQFNKKKWKFWREDRRARAAAKELLGTAALTHHQEEKGPTKSAHKNYDFHRKIEDVQLHRKLIKIDDFHRLEWHLFFRTETGGERAHENQRTRAGVLWGRGAREVLRKD